MGEISPDEQVNVDMPIWAVLELMTFGDLLNFYYGYPFDTPFSNTLFRRLRQLDQRCAIPRRRRGIAQQDKKPFV